MATRALRAQLDTTTVELLIARQPILTPGGTTVGYELLYRSAAGGPDTVTPDAATASVVMDGVFGQGIDRLTGGLPAWINVPTSLLAAGAMELFQGTDIVVELLEDTPDTIETRECVRRLRESGVPVALDDLVADDPRSDLVDLVDIVKIDLARTTPAERRALTAQARRSGVQVLFEKVETRQDAAEAANTGADLLQGYFFARPVQTGRRDVALHQGNHHRLLGLLMAPELDLAAVEDLVRQDLYLTRRFLTFINSGAFGWRRHVDSLAHAMVLLGHEPLRRWLTLVTLLSASRGTMSPAIVVAATRGRFLEGLASAVRLPDRRLDLFVLGMFSLLDVILDVPLESALDGCGIPDDVRATLLGTSTEGDLAALLDLARTIESFDGLQTWESARRLGLPWSDVASTYRDAQVWSAGLRRWTG